MPLNYDRNLKERAQILRKYATEAERKLWRHLSRKQLNQTHWYRQKPIGNFIVDFYCPASQLVIEVDGSQHFTKQKSYDAKRDVYLTGLELKVLRFSNRDVFTNIEGVMMEIYKETVSRKS